MRACPLLGLCLSIFIPGLARGRHVTVLWVNESMLSADGASMLKRDGPKMRMETWSVDVMTRRLSVAGDCPSVEQDARESIQVFHH